MNRDDALRHIAAAAGLDAAELIAYADEDQVGGRDTGYRGFSIDAAEGRLLYALIRVLRPERALEIGVFDGVSSLHLLAALEANGLGTLDSYDMLPTAGAAVDDRGRWTLHIEDALKAALPAADFVFEDADHGLDTSIALLTKLKALQPRVIVSHDYYSHEVYSGGFFVKQAFDTVFGEANVLGLRFDGAERGLGLWFNPDWSPAAPAVADEPPIEAADDAPTPAVKPLVAAPKAKRKAGKRG
jgi:predicted O-methyltransferase YrrM